MLMTPSELEAIDDWSFRSRIRSRGEAIRRLCQIGLALEGKAGDIEKNTLESLGLVNQLLTWMDGAVEGDDDLSQDPVDLSLQIIERTMSIAGATSEVQTASAAYSHQAEFDDAQAQIARYRKAKRKPE